MNTKPTKITRFSNQNKKKSKPNLKSKLWNKKNKSKNVTHANKNPRRFYCKEEIEQSYDKKVYQNTSVEQTKGNDKFYLHLYPFGI